MTEIPRMRTAAEAMKELKKEDPNTALTERALHRMMKTGEIPALKVGSKNLIDLNVLFEYLRNPQSNAASSADYGNIRRIG